ncbi:MAG: hypothetical protein JJU36_16395 [Phycisphaeraceae bacterium]|nr:hypothetical protein [Phycisphaeraceae bacterium]
MFAGVFAVPLSAAPLTIYVTPEGIAQMVVGADPINGFILQDPDGRMTETASLPDGLFQTNTSTLVASQILDPTLEPGDLHFFGPLFEPLPTPEPGGYDFSNVLLEYTIPLTPGVFIGQVLNAIPGDTNLDGWVDDVDLAVVQANLGQSGMDWFGGDFTGDGRVGLRDAFLLVENYQPAPQPMAISTPEPGSLAILVLSGLLLAARRIDRLC